MMRDDDATLSFLHWAQVDPQRLALSDERNALSYAALRERVLALAGMLCEMGVCAGDRVAIACDRSVESVVAILATLSAGAAYLPLDASYPSARIFDMLDDAQPRLTVIWTDATRDLLPSVRWPTLDSRVVTDAPALAKPVAVDPAAAAYVLFTSGSTGRPKGAVLSRHALDRLLAWHLLHPRLARPARTVQFASLGFDASVRDLFATFANGGTLIMASDADRRDPFRLLELMRVQRIERAFLPCVALRSLAQAHAEGGALPDMLRDVASGGEPLSVTPAIRSLFAALPGSVLYNEYGPTETCVLVTSHPLAGDPALWPDQPDLGLPLPHVRLHVVDEQLHALPDGVDGELLIGGETLADGYLHQPQLSAERFVQIDVGGGRHERVYRSGDHARREPDGHFTFVGRVDEQVKIAGNRIELGEVEALLAAHAGVRQGVVVAPEGSAGRRLVAHVVARPEAGSGAQLRDELMQQFAVRLPAHARPQIVRFRDAMPLTPSGKVDRRRLEAEGVESPVIDPIEPDAPLQDRLVGLWRELLTSPSLGPDDDVFGHGADSLRVMIFITRLRSMLDSDWSAAAVYDHPTPRRQAAALSEVAAVPSARAPADIAPLAELPLDVPLSDGQMEKWFASQFGQTAALAFNAAAALQLDGPLDVAALKRALAMVWQRHEAFHFSFAADGTRQRFNPGVPLPLSEQDFSSPADQAESRLQAFCDQQMVRRFDLTTAPLLRFSLIRLGEQRHVLHVSAHHLVMDGWSLAIFVSELGACYGACIVDRDPGLATAGSFRRYLIDERARRAAGAAARSLEYWTQLYRLPPNALGLPSDRAAPLQPDYGAGTEQQILPVALTAALREGARRRGVSLYSLLLSGFGIVMARLSGQQDFAIAVPFAGLALAGNEALIGDGVSALPLRMRVEPESPFDDLVRRTHDALLDAAAHRDTTLATIQRALGLRASGGEAGLTGVTFSLLPRASSAVFAGLTHELREGRRAALDWDIDVSIAERGDTLVVDLHYATDRHDAISMRRWLGFYATVLDTIGNPDEGSDALTVGDIDLLDDAGRLEVLQTWNATARPYDRGLGLTTLIERQMRQTPQRIAAECNGQRLDYAGLEASTRALAQALRRRGIGRGEMVGVCVPRSLDMLVAVVGILRSGAAYVPLDPEFPDSRLRHMAEHARLRYVLIGESDRVPAVIASSRELLCVAKLRAEPVDAVSLPDVHGDDLAYVLFTSGSTGEPKGVRILHRNLVNFLFGMRDTPGFGPDDVLCAVTTLSFDIAGLELYLPLIAGGRLVIATEALHREPMALFELIRTTGCTVLQTTPSLLQLLQGLGHEDVVRQLRLFVGGEALPLPLAHAMAGQCREFWNLYGPTETTIWSTVARIHPGTKPIPLGKPIANTQIYVLDAQGRPLPPLVTGEIWIGGDGVSDGYLFRPEMTAERFVTNPFVTGDARMYRTGDLGSWREGNLYFHGRADNQIKIRGYRIEPGEIEAAAGSDPAVQECVAVARRFGDNDMRLVLYVAADNHRPDLIEHLRERLRERLPAYMRPQHIEWLQTLPKTPNGKIDRQALPAPKSANMAGTASEPASGSAGLTGLTDPRQHYLASIWCELVGIKQVRASDNFFDIGGHSLLAVEFTARVQRETGVRLGLLAVATSTLASLATELPDTGLQSARPALSLAGRLRRLLGWH
ncbi:MAG: amino acid adenylation domain-containing protein [Rhodanobacter sp.]